MNWIVFLVLVIVALAFDVSVGVVLRLQTLGGIGPQLLVPVVVFVALHAPRTTVLWACLIAGLLIDFTTPLPRAGGLSVVYVPGPTALGMFFAGSLVIQLRGMLLRSRILTMSAMTFVSMMAVGIMVIALYVVRSWYPDDNVAYFSAETATAEMWRRAGSAMYTAAIALPLGWLLMATTPMWGFQHATTRRR